MWTTETKMYVLSSSTNYINHWNWKVSMWNFSDIDDGGWKDSLTKLGVKWQTMTSWMTRSLDYKRAIYLQPSLKHSSSSELSIVDCTQDVWGRVCWPEGEALNIHLRSLHLSVCNSLSFTKSAGVLQLSWVSVGDKPLYRCKSQKLFSDAYSA